MKYNAAAQHKGARDTFCNTFGPPPKKPPFSASQGCWGGGGGGALWCAKENANGPFPWQNRGSRYPSHRDESKVNKVIPRLTTLVF